MGANMMEILKHIQRYIAEKKEYLRNLHIINKNINEKYDLLDGKLIELTNKTDYQDNRLHIVQITIERLEQRVKKNNKLLFGNDDVDDIKYESRSTMSYKSDVNDEENMKADHFDYEKAEKYTENTEPNLEKYQLENSPHAENGENKKDCMPSVNNNTDEIEQTLTNVRKMNKKNEDLTTSKIASIEHAVVCPFCKQTFAIRSTNYDADQISLVDNKLDNILKRYQSDITEIKKSIENFEATSKSSIEITNTGIQEVMAAFTNFNADQINQLSELKQLKDMTMCEARDIKELIKKFVTKSNQSVEADAASICLSLKEISEANQSELKEVKESIKGLIARKPSDEDSASVVRERKTVQISPTYLNKDQLDKLNSELKRISEKYQNTNIFPIIEVVGADEHPVMKLLRQGVYYKSKMTRNLFLKLKLGCDGFNRSHIIDKLTEYPDLTLNETVKEHMVCTNIWTLNNNRHYLTGTPYIIRNGEYEPINS